MLKCRDVMERADMLVDGDDPGFRERWALRIHLMICHHCRRYVRQLKQLVASLHRRPEPASPEEVDRVLRSVDSSLEEGH